ncbi:hypothetical protein STIAU_5825 [Stigmatella aurantiaca DW4/3-1]|uniref:Uncharacterized protein n=1 Tax=Stigmatella aurantiaca (strain DW4/3-1) TaxID=378806 RepID=Q098Y4_STIAD|nr:hypothetical protein STIAU_5825 [Stigmatella aurantiaca DW4/3-1]
MAFLLRGGRGVRGGLGEQVADLIVGEVGVDAAHLGDECRHLGGGEGRPVGRLASHHLDVRAVDRHGDEVAWCGEVRDLVPLAAGGGGHHDRVLVEEHRVGEVSVILDAHLIQGVEEVSGVTGRHDVQDARVLQLAGQPVVPLLGGGNLRAVLEDAIHAVHERLEDLRVGGAFLQSQLLGELGLGLRIVAHLLPHLVGDAHRADALGLVDDGDVARVVQDALHGVRGAVEEAGGPLFDALVQGGPGGCRTGAHGHRADVVVRVLAVLVHDVLHVVTMGGARTEGVEDGDGVVARIEPGEEVLDRVAAGRLRAGGRGAGLPGAIQKGAHGARSARCLSEARSLLRGGCVEAALQRLVGGSGGCVGGRAGRLALRGLRADLGTKRVANRLERHGEPLPKTGFLVIERRRGSVAPADSLAFDPAQRMGFLPQGSARRGPGGIFGIERASEECPRHPLDHRDASGILIRRLGDLISRNASQHMLPTEQREQALAARAQEVRIGKPVGPPDGQRGAIAVTGNDECRRRHPGEAGVQVRHVLGREWAQIRPPAPRGEQHACLDPRVRQVFSRFAVPVEHSRAKQHAHRLTAKGMARCGHAVSIKASGETRQGVLDEIEIVEDALHVLDTVLPDRGSSRIVRGKASPPRIQVGGLDHGEAMGGPKAGQWGVAVQGRAMAVREDDDR